MGLEGKLGVTAPSSNRAFEADELGSLPAAMLHYRRCRRLVACTPLEGCNFIYRSLMAGSRGLNCTVEGMYGTVHTVEHCWESVFAAVSIV